MKSWLNWLTDRVASRQGMWVTLIIWFAAAMLLGALAPSAKEYEVSRIDSLSKDMPSVIAKDKLGEYFPDEDSMPAVFVFQSKQGEIDQAEIQKMMEGIEHNHQEAIQESVPLDKLPPQAWESLYSKDRKTVAIPMQFVSSLEFKELRDILNQIKDEVAHSSKLAMYVTGPAGISADSLDLFSRADVILLLSTVGLVLVLLIIIYRSPLLAFIPLLAVAFVYEVVNQSLGLLGKAGLLLNNQSLSIMMILLFAAVIDYSLFVFSRFREELKRCDNKYEAMKSAMREVGLPVFFSGGTVLAAMLILFFANYGEYRNFAPIFGTAMVVIMLASVTLIPALFTLFGRRSFWPKIPKVGDPTVAQSSAWGSVGRLVVKRPLQSVILVGIILLLSISNLFNLNYSFDNIKSFPEDMSSRVGYEALESGFDKGDLAPTTVLFESAGPMKEGDIRELMAILEGQPLVANIRMNGMTDSGDAVRYSLTFDESPYDTRSMDALSDIRDRAEELVKQSGMEGKLYFAGETASQVDDRLVNNRDLVVIVILETLMILILLIVMTQSVRIPLYMVGTILVSFLAALGLGMFLTQTLFGIDSISNRVPIYSFVFLVALGIDYNIILISRFLEERRKYPLAKAVEISVASTGGVISSAGIILAATFAVLMTQPVEVLFVFGFIVAVGILMDTFIIRGFLMPALLVLLEKKKPIDQEKRHPAKSTDV